MKKLFFVIVLGLVFGSSCKENTRVNLISAQVFQDCDSPLRKTEIALKSNSDGSFSAPIILGSGITTAEGTLNFTYELEDEDIGTGSLLLIKSTGFETLLSSVELNKDLDLTLYRYDNSEIEIELLSSRTLSATDTLFYGVTSSETIFEIIQPMNGLIDTISVLSSAPNVDLVNENFYYGLGTENFLRAKTSAGNADSTFNKVAVTLEGCGTQSMVSIMLD